MDNDQESRECLIKILTKLENQSTDKDSKSWWVYALSGLGAAVLLLLNLMFGMSSKYVQSNLDDAINTAKTQWSVFGQYKDKTTEEITKLRVEIADLKARYCAEHNPYKCPTTPQKP